MLKVDQVVIVRHKVLAEGEPIRAVARQLKLSRNTVRKYVESADPTAGRAKRPRRRPKWEEVGARIDELLEEWARRTTKKQRVTGTRLAEELRKEGHQVAETTVRAYLRERRRRAAEVFIPLVHRPGDEGQVDFFEVVVVEAGQARPATLFQLSLPYSDRDFTWLYEWEDLPCFLDGHVRAAKHFGGLPKRLVYDNLKLVVTRILPGGERQLNEHFARLAAHYALEPCFARPGQGHDKGAIESRGKRTRLQQMVPMPEGESLTAISETLLASLAQKERTRRNIQGQSVASRFAQEEAHFVPLPEKPFEARLPVLCRTDRQATLKLGGALYSVPSTWAQSQIMAFVGATDVRFEFDGQAVLRRRLPKHGRQIRYLDYLPELARKPQALRQVAPELMAELGPAWQALWASLADVHGDKRASRTMADLVAAVVAHDLETVTDMIIAAAGQPVRNAADAKAPPRCLPGHLVPNRLRDCPVGTTHAVDYDALLLGDRP